MVCLSGAGSGITPSGQLHQALEVSLRPGVVRPLEVKGAEVLLGRSVPALTQLSSPEKARLCEALAVPGDEVAEAEVVVEGGVGGGWGDGSK